MTRLLFPAPLPVTLPIQGRGEEFPVSRIFCVGRNYVDHAREMGSEVDRQAPFYFTKSPLHLVHSGASVPYPPGTQDLHHEMEFVVALGKGGFRVDVDQATDLVLGYAAGLDMTRRDLQAHAKERRRPWDTGKDFENAAVVGPITPRTEFGRIGPQGIRLWVNDRLAQSARLDDMVWSVPELIAHLSTLYHLRPGDLIMTGTPAGVGPVGEGDRLHGEIDGLAPVDLTIGAAAT
ncbi:fumarylpyruvate hydrolase [Albidovulum inexpectatum]|uniref:Fumarylpyruvate hydrolase n=1 Tax=Albidovulum inexpectatum TaxID=196587 RepID=A0A2S5JL31_9RHOB|nr:fumarylacetoacetate hydrolase family protein [Albidovulum inexpectatum]PPB82142.1 fumarylpyruvate hydrolase [Albidovulum inexpectatum]